MPAPPAVSAGAVLAIGGRGAVFEVVARGRAQRRDPRRESTKRRGHVRHRARDDRRGPGAVNANAPLAPSPPCSRLRLTSPPDGNGRSCPRHRSRSPSRRGRHRVRRVALIAAPAGTHAPSLPAVDIREPAFFELALAGRTETRHSPVSVQSFRVRPSRSAPRSSPSARRGFPSCDARQEAPGPYTSTALCWESDHIQVAMRVDGHFTDPSAVACKGTPGAIP